MIQFTPNATKAAHRFIKFSETPVVGVRVYVSGGGCSGLQYGLSLEAERSPDDTLFDIGGVPVLIDPMSQPLLEGVTVDFVDTLIETGFKFDNPNATASCGCGKSFSL